MGSSVSLMGVSVSLNAVSGSSAGGMIDPRETHNNPRITIVQRTRFTETPQLAPQVTRPVVICQCETSCRSCRCCSYFVKASLPCALAAKTAAVHVTPHGRAGDRLLFHQQPGYVRGAELRLLQPERGICSYAEVDCKSEAAVVPLVQLHRSRFTSCIRCWRRLGVSGSNLKSVPQSLP
jgi:hypothetical protein